MNHDTKVGLGLGILVVGLVSAIYLRELPDRQQPLPELISSDADTSVIDRLREESASTPLDEFERKYGSEIGLDKIELTQELPDVSPSIDGSFDDEYEFLNQPAANQPVENDNTEIASVDSIIDDTDIANDVSTEFNEQAAGKPDHRTVPTQPIGKSSIQPPAELPSAVEMFSEDLDNIKRDPVSFDPTLEENEIPVELDPIVVETQPALDPQLKPEPIRKRDPRIIVPKRVRLNEPMRRDISQRPETVVNQPRQQPGKKSQPELLENLPSLNGLEPLDPKR